MKVKILMYIFAAYFVTTQNSIFELEEFYDAKGVIINDYEKWPFIFANNNFSEKYVLTVQEIPEIEQYIQNPYYAYTKKSLDHFESNYNIEKFKNPKKVKRNFTNHNRQYSGFIDQNNDTIIYIGMLNFTNKKKANDYFAGWDKSLLLGSGNWYYSNQEYFLYNKSKRKLENTY